MVEPGENFWREEALKRKLGRRMDKHYVYSTQSGSIRFLSSRLEALLTAHGFLLVRKVTLGDPAMFKLLPGGVNEVTFRPQVDTLRHK